MSGCAGRSAVMMECTQWISTSSPKVGALVPDLHERTPFRNRSLEMCDNLNAQQPMDFISPPKMKKFSLDIGLDKVVRWKPVNVSGT